MNLQFQAGEHLHLIGIGGSGFSAIARILLLQGFQVSGSDMKLNAETAQLQTLGATIYAGHHADYIAGASAIIASSAIPEGHVEIQAARQAGIPVYKRYDVMAALMSGYRGIAIAGTHGKTTTTSMTAHLLQTGGKSPSYIVGGIMANTGLNADVGQGEPFVIEADEYDNMFHGLRPQIALVTSVEFDHPDFFKTPQAMIASFEKFVRLLPPDGLLILCADDAGALALKDIAPCKVLTYGIDNPDADYHATNIHYGTHLTGFQFVHEEKIVTLRLQVAGKHNVLNGLAASLIAYHEGVSWEAIADGLFSFKGSGRRFDLREDYQQIAVIDDYAHHPTAVKTTIEAARYRYPEREIWAIWQPHTFSRTKELWQDFLNAFGQANHVIVTDIYASREAFNPTVKSADFVQDLQHPSKFHAPTFDDTLAILQTQVKAPAVILIMSAGDAPQIGIRYLEALKAATL